MILKTEQSHIDELSITMHHMDKQEIWAANHLSPKEALETSIQFSDRTFAGLRDGKVLSIYGLHKPTLLSDYAIPWILSSKYISDYPKYFLRQSRIITEDWKKETSIMMNFVDSRHTASIRWIRWLGFTVWPASPLGPDRVPFHLFTWVK